MKNSCYCAMNSYSNPGCGFGASFGAKNFDVHACLGAVCTFILALITSVIVGAVSVIICVRIISIIIVMYNLKGPVKYICHS